MLFEADSTKKEVEVGILKKNACLLLHFSSFWKQFIL